MISSCNNLLAATSTKAMVGFAVLLLVAYETTILVKLWYWIVNTKITLLKELRQWKLQMALSSAASPLSAEAEPSSRNLGLSRGERIAWLAALVAVCIGVSSYRPLNETTSNTTIGECVTLKADGAATSLMRVSEPVGLVTGSLHYTFGEPENVRSVRWLDDRGRELPVDVSTENKQRTYIIHLIEPVMPGEKLQYTQVTEFSSAATRKGDLWTYMGDYTYGCAENRYFVTVELPRGATIVTADPEPSSRWTDNGIERLAFQATRGQNERFRYKIKYRIPVSRRDIRQ